MVIPAAACRPPCCPPGGGPGVAAALAAAALLQVLCGRAEGELLDEVVDDYHEDAVAARPVAEVRARLFAAGDGMVVQVLVSAVGPRVEALPGLEGVAGHNLRTAEELHRLLRDDRLHFELRSGGDTVRQGRIRVLRRGRLPRRWIDGDGALHLHGLTEAEWPLEVAFESGVLPPGRTVGRVLVGGVPRLAVAVEGGRRQGRILRLDSLGEFHLRPERPGRKR